MKVNGSFALNVNQLVKQSDNIVLATPPKQFVSRGGEKLAHAIQSLALLWKERIVSTLDLRPVVSPTAYCNEERNESPVSMSDMGFSMKNHIR
ncbi:MAG: hypothetical protein CM15mP49_08130 [Actinomycetota bacterium]|nr:MAG: hypothetical protein CM15mP49_08130 [Actinomycetota bacterium]